MSGGIFLRRGDALIAMTEQAYAAESVLRLAVLFWAVGFVRRRGDGPDRAAS